MNKAVVSMYAWGIYLIIAGLGFASIPNLLLPLYGLPTTTEVWVRIVGLLVFFLGVYYSIAGRYNLIQFMWATVYARPLFAACLILLIALDFSGPGLAVIAIVDSLGAIWTWWALRTDAARQTAPQPASR